MTDKVKHTQSGDALEVEDGGVIIVKSGGRLDLKSGAIVQADGAQGAPLTAQLTTLTPADAEGTPDYAIAAITSSSPFGFASAQEAITVLYVIKNLQVRCAELEARLEALGMVKAN